MINDARPLWFSPAFVYAAGAPGGLPRELKLVGRNLREAPGQVTRVRLRGPEHYTGTVIAGSDSTATLPDFVARIALPATLKPGHYLIEVSRDGTNWVQTPGQLLEVRPDPPTAPAFSVADPQFGGCAPDDGKDDTACIVRAAAAAVRAGGGVVQFGPGSWDLAGGQAGKGTPGGSTCRRASVCVAPAAI